MDYLTEYYKNEVHLLQEKYDRLSSIYKKLMEDSTTRSFGEAGEDIYKILEVGEDATPEQIRKAHRAKILKYHPDVVKDLPEAERLAAQNEYTRVQTAYELASEPSSVNSMDYREGRKKYNASQQPKTSSEPKKQSSTQKPTGEPPVQKPTAKPSVQKPSTELTVYKPSEEPPVQKPTGEPPVQKPTGEPPVQKAKPNLKSSFKGKLGAFGGGLLAGYAADEAARATLSAAGIENETAHNVAGMAANVGVGGATEVGLGALARGVGAKGAAQLGLRALGPLAAAGAAGQLAGEYIVKPLASIEYKLPGEKGNAKSTIDRYGEALYSGAPIVKGITNLIAGNKLTAGTGDLNTKPTGVAGGDSAKIAQNQAEDQKEAERVANKEKAEQARVSNRSARIAQKVAALKAQEASK